MSLLKRIFGGKSFDELRAEADSQFDAGELGAAKLTYERALDRAKDAPADALAAVRERIDACCDGIARRRIEVGRGHVQAGELDLAREELEGAADTAVSEEVAGEARRLIDAMEQRDALARAEEVEVTDEEKLAVMAGSWEDEQAEEYAGYGERFEQALLAMQDDAQPDQPAEVVAAGASEPEEAQADGAGGAYRAPAHGAREMLETLLENAEAPRYLWLEVGRARLLDGHLEAGERALRTFLETLEDEEGGDARLSAHREIAGVLDERGDEEGAIAELSAAVEQLPEDPRPLLALGHYLRTRGHPKEAVEVLEAAVDVMGESRPEWRVLQELGLACAEAGDEDRAVDMLETVIKMLVARNHYDYPPETAVALARLHEKRGKTERAADLFRALTRGSDRRNHLAYHLEAARLLGDLELTDEAHRMLQRAAALAQHDDAARAAVEKRIAALEGAEPDGGDEAADEDDADETADETAGT